MTTSQRDKYLRRTYGLTIEDYNDLLRSQDGRCAVCLRSTTELKRVLHVDHDHVTGRVRGLLCSNCNHRVVGRHRDPLLLRRAAEYLEGKGTSFVVPKKVKSKRRRRKRKARR